MSTPIPPCPPFCDERSWMFSNELEAIREHLYFEAGQDDANPHIDAALKELDKAINILRTPMPSGEEEKESHGSSD